MTKDQLEQFKVFLAETFVNNMFINYDNLAEYFLKDKAEQLNQFKLWAIAKSNETVINKAKATANLTSYDESKTTLDSIDTLTKLV